MKPDQVHGIIRGHGSEVVRGQDRLMYIWRDKVWENTLDYFKDESFRRASGYVNICFKSDVQEDAVDFGRFN